MKLLFAAGMACLAALVVLFSLRCSGPRPAVASVEVTPPGTEGILYVVEVTVENKSRGNGEIEVEAVLRSASGEEYSANETAKVRARSHVIVVIEFAVEPGEYTATATVDYPPR